MPISIPLVDETIRIQRENGTDVDLDLVYVKLNIDRLIDLHEGELAFINAFREFLQEECQLNISVSAAYQLELLVEKLWPEFLKKTQSDSTPSLDTE